MRVPSALELIGAWERGEAQHPVDRALTLLAAACPELTFDELAALSIGRRDSALLALREALFGPRLDCFALCPHCDARLEFNLDAREFAARGKDEATEFDVENLRVKIRAPNSLDLAAAAVAGDVAAARRLLLQRCILPAQDGASSMVDEWSESALEALAEKLAQTETQADISLDVTCAGCGHIWQLAFDIASFLWSEVSALARRYLRDVHILAWAYGWSEADILALSPARRQFYIESMS